jgi:hypothetical protein
MAAHLIEPLRLVARIKRTSKYWGQTKPNAWFDVFINPGWEYAVKGNSNQYRLKDVVLGLLQTDGGVFELKDKH